MMEEFSLKIDSRLDEDSEEFDHQFAIVYFYRLRMQFYFDFDSS